MITCDDIINQIYNYLTIDSSVQFSMTNKKNYQLWKKQNYIFSVFTTDSKRLGYSEIHGLGDLCGYFRTYNSALNYIKTSIEEIQKEDYDGIHSWHYRFIKTIHYNHNRIMEFKCEDKDNNLIEVYHVKYICVGKTECPYDFYFNLYCDKIND